VGDVVIIKSSERNRNCWPLTVVESLVDGKDGFVRAAKVRTGKSILERAVQQLYPLELSCNRTCAVTTQPLNHNAKPFRPRRQAAVEAEKRIRDIVADDEQ
jgi:ferredoxin